MRIKTEYLVIGGALLYWYVKRNGNLNPLEPTEPTDPAIPSEPDNPVVAIVKADLAARLGVAKSQIVVQSTESVQWSDSSLGCPQPGMMYAQVITPGYRIVLDYGGNQYNYHTNLTGGVIVLCQ
jgi:hypothetical protein